MMALLHKSYTTPESLRERAAYVYFGEDLNSVEDLIKEIEDHNEAAGGRFDGRLHKLRQLYMASIAPGFLFLGANAHAALGIEKEEFEKLRESLFLKNSSRTVRIGRVPNELYMRAINSRIEKIGLRAIWKIALAVHEKNGSPIDQFGFILRALLERALNAEGRSGIDDLLESEGWRKKFNEYKGKPGYSLLQLEALPYLGERASADSGLLNDENGNPGFASAIGWAYGRFFTKENFVKDRKKISLIISTYLEKLIIRWGESAEARTEDSIMNTVMATYSTLLQWAILFSDSDASLVDLLFEVQKKSSGRPEKGFQAN